MTDQNHAIRDDIAFMRELAEEGRQAPIVGGSILLASGLSFGTASLAIWGLNSRPSRLVNSSWSFFNAAIWTVLSLRWPCSWPSCSPRKRNMQRPAWARRRLVNRAIGVALVGQPGSWSMFFVGLSLVVMAVRGKDALRLASAWRSCRSSSSPSTARPGYSSPRP